MAMRRALFIVTGFLLQGCVSSFQGRPSPVFPMRSTASLLRDFDQDEAIARFYSSRDSDRIFSRYSPDTASSARQGDGQRVEIGGLSPLGYRNMVVSAYLAAIDESYYNFVTALSSQNKSTSVTLNTVALAASGAASVAGQTVANALSAGAAFATGSQAKINQTLYFEKTLPALIASMDARRTKVKANIRAGLMKASDQYPLDAAFADLADYQNSASLDIAIQDISSQAGSEVANAEKSLNQARGVAATPAGVASSVSRAEKGSAPGGGADSGGGNGTGTNPGSNSGTTTDADINTSAFRSLAIP